jgi:large subunit ribosomal protein L18
MLKKNQKLANEQSARRIARVRSRVRGTAERPRLAVARTLKHIAAQVIDDAVGKTIAAASDKDVKKAKGMKPVEIAAEVGKVLAERAKEKKVSKVVFDRRDKRFHGRVKALADGARAAGLEF